MAVRVIDIHVPVAPGHVAAHALDGDALVLEVRVGVHDLFQAAALPGDLVDRHLRREFPIGPVVEHPLVEEHEGVVVRPVAHEVAAGVAEVVALGRPRHLAEIQDVRVLEAEEVAVEVARLVHPDRVEAEVAEPPDLERPLQQHAADVEAIAVGCHGPFLLPCYPASLRRPFRCRSPDPPRAIRARSARSPAPSRRGRVAARSRSSPRRTRCVCAP